ncbi:MAG: Stp1/IreP family PP2C-type Ser/Thr phosphatase [Bradymonadia bacterium]
MTLDFWAATDVGRTRDHNEDNFLVARKLNLFVVADGMGGHAAGEVASNIAVHEAHRVISEHLGIIERFRRTGGDAEKESVLELIEEAISTACATVFRLAQEDPSKKGMGTTLSLMLIVGNRGFIGHVGDSRIYLLRTGSVLQLTEDHSLINELIKRGKIRADEAGQMPFKNAVTRAVGVYEKVEVDAFDIDVLRGDEYLLCSDGLSGYLEEDDETLASLAQGEVKKIPDAYIRYANEQGGKDNITAIFVRVVAAQSEAKSELAAMPESDSGSLPYLSALRLEPLFSHCSYSDLRKLSVLVEEVKLKAGDVFCPAGGAIDGLVICQQGRLTVGDVRAIEAGQSIGMEALLGSVVYANAITATEDTELLHLSGESLRAAMALDAHFGWRLLFSLGEQQSRQIRELSDALRRGGTSSASDAKQPGTSSLQGAGELTITSLPLFLRDAEGESSNQDETPAERPPSVGDRPTVPRTVSPKGRGINPK